MATDEHDLKREEEDVLQEEHFLEAVLDAFTDGVSVLDRNLRILRVNQAMRDRHSNALPLEGKTCYSAYYNRESPCGDCPVLRAMESRTTETGEVTFVDPDGVVHTLELVANPLYEKSGKLAGAVTILRDISEPRQAEVAREEREELHRALFEENRSIMLLLDPETAEIRDANPRACDFYGYSLDDLKSLRITDINTLTEEETLQEMARARSEERTHFNFRHHLADGTERDVEVFSGPITVRGRPLLCSVIHDVTERTAAEREKERLIEELRTALAEVKTLQGFIPICFSCKKIRDDEGYWEQIEVYLKDRSDAEFSHGICPDCMKELYPEYAPRD